MIAYPRGWQDHLLRRAGGLAATLHTHLTGNSFAIGERPLVAETLHCPPSFKPLRWFRNPNIRRLAFVSQETHVFLQIAMTVCLRYLQLSAPASLEDARLVLPALPFPAIGWRKGSIQVMCCRRYPSQGLQTFRDNLEAARVELQGSGVCSRWLVPHALVFPQPPRLGDWPEVDGNSLGFLMRPDLDDPFFLLDLSKVYRTLLARSQDLP